MGLLEWKALSQGDQEDCSLLSWASQCENTEFFSLEHSIALRSCLIVCLEGICIASRCLCFYMCVWGMVSGDSGGEVTSSIYTSSEILRGSLTFHFYQVFLNLKPLCMPSRQAESLSERNAGHVALGWDFCSLSSCSCVSLHGLTVLQNAVEIFYLCPAAYSLF